MRSFTKYTLSEKGGTYSVGKDIGILTINSTVKVLDTINSNMVKFVRLYQTGSKTNSLVGYTHLINIHSIPVKDSLYLK